MAGEPPATWRRFKYVCFAASVVAVSVLAVCGHPGPSHDLVGARNLRPLDAEEPLATEKLVYVPIYPSLYSHPGPTRPIPMLVTLSLRNASVTEPVVVSRVAIYDSDGHTLDTYVDAPHELGPMQTADFVVARDGRTGGSGANFVVEWGARVPEAELLVEAVMQAQDEGVSFATRGHVVSARTGANLHEALAQAGSGD